jgi:hypothetical protein
MLGAVLDSLDETLAKATARESALPPEGDPDAPSWPQRLEAVAERWLKLKSLPELQEKAIETESDFAAIEESLRQQLTTIEDLRQRLATWTSRAVG